MLNRLPTFLVLISLVVPSAQTKPDPRLATGARLAALTPLDFHALLSQAESGDREAQYWVAQVYGEDRLVPKNDAVSRDWMRRSVEQGYAPAQEMVGMSYMGANGDYSKADMWLRRAAEQGNAEAQFWLGAFYEQGQIGAIDYREAFRWFLKAAEQGHPDAQFSLGQMYEDGEFVSQDYVLAAKWYRKAAEHVPDLGGAGQGRNSLGILYLNGLGVPKNYVLAYMWFALASVDTNLKEAASHMTRAQVTQAQQMAFDWSKRHADQTRGNRQCTRDDPLTLRSCVRFPEHVINLPHNQFGPLHQRQSSCQSSDFPVARRRDRLPCRDCGP
jgi:TPR repeat protein